jgi:hypothetical protein
LNIEKDEDKNNWMKKRMKKKTFGNSTLDLTFILLVIYFLV